MTEDEKQRENHGSSDIPAAPTWSPAEPFRSEIKSPYTSAIPAEDLIAGVLRHTTDSSAIAPPKHTGAETPSDHIGWRQRLKGLWFAASLFFMAQTSQAELPPPTETTQSEVNPQTSAQTNSKIDYKYSAEQVQGGRSGPKFNFGQSTPWQSGVPILDQQPEQVVQIVVNVQTEKPSEAETKDATDYIRKLQQELNQKALDPGYLADKVADKLADGSEVLLGIALFKARKKIRANTHNRLVIWLCDTFERISQAFEEADTKGLPAPKKRPIGFLADRINCSTPDAVAVLELTPCHETEPGQWEYRESSEPAR